MPIYEVEVNGRVFEVDAAAPPTAEQARAWASKLQRSSSAKAAYAGDIDRPVSPMPAIAPMASHGGGPKTLPQQAKEGARAFLQTVNPIPAIDAMGRALIPEPVGDMLGLNVPGKMKTGPINAVNSLLGANWDTLLRAKEAYDRGDDATAIAKALYGLIPGLGPTLAQAGDEMSAGDYGAGLGRTLGVGATIALPAALARPRHITMRSPLRNRNAAEADAVNFGQQQGIPIDAATATGNRFVRGAQRAFADESALGSVVAEKAKAAEAAAMSRTAQRLADRVSPAATTPEQAGRAVQAAVRNQVTAAHAAADQHYANLARLEQRPANQRAVTVQSGTAPKLMALPVDLRQAKAALGPLHARLMREAEITPLMGPKARAATALDRLINGPDYAPLSTVDEAVGDLKAMARGADLPALRTQGQGLAASAVRSLEQTLRTTAKNAGPDVYASLMRGRLATRAKYGAADVLDDLDAEPVKVFKRAIESKDANIDQLRSVAAVAPAEARTLGRAYLDDMIATATTRGGFDGADGLFAQWQRLGPRTKRIIFGEPALVRDLDRFFLLGKKMAESPNPSKTALTLVKGAEMNAWFWSPVMGGPAFTVTAAGMAKLLRNPRAVRILSNGMSGRLGGSRMAAAAATTELANLARLEGAELAPMRADGQSPPPEASRTGPESR